jgi:hypothetical protein
VHDDASPPVVAAPSLEEPVPPLLLPEPPSSLEEPPVLLELLLQATRPTVDEAPMTTTT